MNRIKSNYIFQVISWVIVYNLFGIPMYFMLQNFPEKMAEQQMDTGFTETVITNSICGLVIGLLIGSIDIMIQRILKQKHSFKKMLLVKSSIYTITFISFATIFGLLWQYSQKDLSFTGAIQEIQTSFALNIIIAYILLNIMASILISFISQLSDIAGREKLLPLLAGHYYAPREEQRVFMFLDLRSSTTIAEQLGHVLFSQLIQDCFHDLNQVIGKYKAFIYQYVGDEAVLTWRHEDGLNNLNCLRVFYAYQEALKSRATYYQSKYGHVPEFKAGVNIGDVMVAEIGEVKKEIAFHGDVLNTAARIQGLCNEYGQNLLISEFLEEQLNREQSFSRECLGEMELKGRVAPVKVYGIRDFALN
ncbi:MAG: adenylate/guanylate cyclase domain-containing protein [Flammeovirgaceae bacterium]